MTEFYHKFDGLAFEWLIKWLFEHKGLFLIGKIIKFSHKIKKKKLHMSTKIKINPQNIISHMKHEACL